MSVVLPVVAVSEPDDLEAAGGTLEGGGALRPGELWAWANVNGLSATMAQAMNGMVGFITTLSLVRLLKLFVTLPKLSSGSHIALTVASL